jgi:eukaryotic-like serine/threonine-protein kinase
VIERVTERLMRNGDAERDPIDLAAEDFAERYRRGEAPSVSEYAQRYPAQAAELRELLPPVALIEQLRRRRVSDHVIAAEGAPERLGDFRIIREVGRGGMGIVYEAEQESLRRRVALKVLPRLSHMDPGRVERFRREARAASMLHHDHIVPVFGVGEYEGSHFYVMPFIVGKGMDEVLDDWRRDKTDSMIANGGASNEEPRWRFIAHLGAQVADALSFAHQHGVLHRDIKPANLLFDERGKIWVTDFGLARLLESGDLTQTGDLIGTLQYMPPESLGGRADARGDVYSLGLTLRELLTLEPPYPETDPSALLRCVAEGRPTAPRKINPSLPRDLETIILKATAHAPADRYQSARELAEDFRLLLGDRAIRARRATVRDVCWGWCRRHRAQALLTAALGFSLALGAALGWVSYASTKRALNAEFRRRGEVEAEKQRAEANATLSMQAIEEIFNTLAIQDRSRRRRRDVMEPIARARAEPFGRAGPSDRWNGEELRRGEEGDRGGPPRISEEDAVLLQSVLAFYDRLAERNAAHPRLQIEAAKAHRRSSILYRRLGRSSEAETSLDRARAINESLVSAFPNEPRYRLELARTYATVDASTSDAAALDRSARRIARALAIEAELIAHAKGQTEFVVAFAQDRQAQSQILHRLKRDLEAESSARESIALFETLTEDPARRVELAMARLMLADWLIESGRADPARELLDASEKELRAVARLPDQGSIPPPTLADYFLDLSVRFRRLGDMHRADDIIRFAQLARDRRPPPPDPHGLVGSGGRRPPPPPGRW